MTSGFKIVVSDLHLGAGRADQGNALEDFDGDQAFAALVDELIAASSRDGADVELIVNGDAFDLLQVPHVEAFDPKADYPPGDYALSSEPHSTLKIGHVVAGHPGFFAALRRFAQAGPPRRWVTFIKGNHDLDLYWPAVQRAIRLAVGAAEDDAGLVAFAERCISRDGIYVEHGNQYAEQVSRVPDMERPLDPEDPDRLFEPVGSRFVMQFFNHVEREKYWVDGVKPLPSLIWYALLYDFQFAARALAALLRALPGVVHDGILADRDPRADLARQFEDEQRVSEIEARYASDDVYRAWLHAELAGILSPLPAATAGEGLSLPAWADGAQIGDGLRTQVRLALEDAARLRAEQEGAQLVVFGHTHEPGAVDLPGGASYINSGTWTWSGDFSAAGPAGWADLFAHPERFTAERRLHYVRVDYPEGEPRGQLLPWPAASGHRPGLAGVWQRIAAWFRRLWQRRKDLP